MLTDIPRAHRRLAAQVEDAWHARHRGGLWVLMSRSRDGRPLLLFGLGGFPLIRLVALQVLYYEPRFGWSKRNELESRADADAEAGRILRHLRAANDAPLDFPAAVPADDEGLPPAAVLRLVE